MVYCSKRCQKEDWKSRHQVICGRFLTLEIARRTAVSILIDDEDQKIHDISHPKMQIGAATNGFNRPPALKYVIHHINAFHNSEPDLNIEYVLLAASEDIRCIIINDEDLRRIFRSYCVKAMTTGDKTAVAVVGQFIISQADSLGMTRNDIVAQLGREYKVDVESEIKLLEESDPESTRLEKEWRAAVVVEPNLC